MDEIDCQLAVVRHRHETENDLAVLPGHCWRSVRTGSRRKQTMVMPRRRAGTFLETVKWGDAFDLLSPPNSPLVVQQDQIRRLLFKLLSVFGALSRTFCRRQVQEPDTPDDKQLHRKLLHWFSAEQWGMAELADIARRRGTAVLITHMLPITCAKQRSLCGEACWPTFAISAARSFHVQADRPAGWCRQHRPDFPAAGGDGGRSALHGGCFQHVPGESARTRLLWADILHGGRLSPLGRLFALTPVLRRFEKRWWANYTADTRGEP